jgi:hypothetical protein
MSKLGVAPKTLHAFHVCKASTEPRVKNARNCTLFDHLCWFRQCFNGAAQLARSRKSVGFSNRVKRVCLYCRNKKRSGEYKKTLTSITIDAPLHQHKKAPLPVTESRAVLMVRWQSGLLRRFYKLLELLVPASEGSNPSRTVLFAYTKDA